jgi:hypothetical protein
LEILAAVQTGAQNEVAIQQRTGLAKKGQNIFAHMVGRLTRSLPLAQSIDLPVHFARIHPAPF